MGSIATRIAAFPYERDTPPDTALAGLARRLTRDGVKVAGLMQRGQSGESQCCADLYLDDIATGRSVAIFERRGQGARGCRLDSAGFAEAAGWLRRAIEGRPDILFVNRFGRQEAEGRGLIAEIAAAVLADIPIVIAVARAQWPEWRAFTSDAGSILTDIDTLEAWCLAAVRPAAGIPAS